MILSGHPAIQSCPHSVIGWLIASLIPSAFMSVHFIPPILYPPIHQCILVHPTPTIHFWERVCFSRGSTGCGQPLLVGARSFLWGCEPCRSSSTELLECLFLNISCAVFYWSWIWNCWDQVSLANSLDPQRGWRVDWISRCQHGCLLPNLLTVHRAADPWLLHWSRPHAVGDWNFQRAMAGACNCMSEIFF